MSRFRSDTFLTDELINEEVADGVYLERRSLLRLSVGALAAAVAFGGCRTRPGKSAARLEGSDEVGPASGEALELSAMLSTWLPRARQQLSSGGSNEDAYLAGVQELMARLRVPTDEGMKQGMKAFHATHAPKEDPRDFPIFMLTFRFEPGKGFEHHDHRDYNGVILGLEGEARVRNYEIVGDDPVPPAGTTFQIRQTRDELIVPERFSSLSRTRDNVHEVVAGPNGARVLDAFTMYRPGAKSHLMTVEDEPRDAEGLTFDAAWA